ncbi:MAG: signal recognition particle protein, partial [Candidatus Subteraquimicrobiales bacterium]|nr:signal recognition particle protein [Candidatus Subteraquimicrobiales bacterium]
SLQIFYPDRIASRILGMGDILTLIEKAEEAIDLEKAKQIEDKLRSEEFNFEIFLDQIQQFRKMGPLNQILQMFPQFKSAKINNPQFNEEYIKHAQAIIQSMTWKERKNPNMLNGSRRARIAKGSGVSVQEVNQLLKQFEQMRKIMKQLGKINSTSLKDKLFPFKG